MEARFPGIERFHFEMVASAKQNRGNASSRSGKPGPSFTVERMMSEAKQWSYVTAFCYFKVTKSAGLLALVGGQGEGFWALGLEQEYTLNDGLNVMGSRGYELTSVQITRMWHGGSAAGAYRPDYIYVFKRPEGA